MKVVLASVAVGAAAGLAGAALTLLLHAVQHIAFGYTENTFLIGVEQASDPRRVLAIGLGGVVVGAGWWLHRKLTEANVSVTHALAEDDPRLPLTATSSDAVLQIIAVGAGASLGREGAPRQLGAALASVLTERFGLDAASRRTLIASGAGAGLAAVYNVPFGGGVFALELLILRGRRAAVLPAVVASWVATVVAWPFLGNRPTYRLPALEVHPTTFAAALLVGVLGAIAALVFRSAMTLARTHAPSGWHAAVTIPIAFTALGALAIAYPQLPGNGKGLAQLAFAGTLTAGLAAILAVLKPVATGLCLGSGAIGGLLTPSFASGAAFGALISHLFAEHQGAYALLGATVVLAIAQRAPWTAVVLALEFTHAPIAFVLPIGLAVAIAKLTEFGVGHCRTLVMR